MKSKIGVNNIIQLTNVGSSNSHLKSAIKFFIPTHKNLRTRLVIFLVGMVPAFLLGFGPNTLIGLESVIGFTNGIALAFMTIIFTGYSIFQALMSDGLLIQLMKDKEENGKERKESGNQNMSYLKYSNEYFIDVLLINVIIIGINVFLIIVVGGFTADYSLFRNYKIDSFIASAAITGYVYICFCSLWEIKSYVFNLYQLFNAYAATRSVEINEKHFREE